MSSFILVTIPTLYSVVGCDEFVDTCPLHRLIFLNTGVIMNEQRRSFWAGGAGTILLGNPLAYLTDQGRT